MLRRLIPDPFILVLVATLVLATVLPVHGVGATAVSWLATAAILLLFFFHGAKLSRTAIVDGLRHLRLHLVILGSTFVMFPLLALGLSSLFPGIMPWPLWVGILYVAALPSTVQSSIAFTSMAGGNVSAAIAAASASQVLGVFVTPPLVGLLAGTRGTNMPISGVGSIMLQILAPFVLGHLARPWIGKWVRRHKAVISITDRSAILISVYSAFSAAVIEGIWGRVPLPLLGTLAALCVVMLCVALAFTWGTGRLVHFDREDRITLLFCGTKKSLVQGVPMARVLFSGPDLGMILLPIMIFHQMQLMACSLIARRYAKGVPHV